jgi:signal transduction histidine kinase
MAAMLPVPLDAIFSVLAPIKPAWVLPMVFSGMTIAVTTLVERRARVAALTSTVAIGAASGGPAAAAHPAADRRVAHDPGVDLRAELLAALSDARQQARGPGARVEVEAPNGLLSRVRSNTLRPVLLALLRNAIEHAPGGKVFVGAMRADGEMRVVIIDDGPEVAEPLTGDARTSLARLLALSDATLLVDHRPGDGTTVMLCLPDKG